MSLVILRQHPRSAQPKSRSHWSACPIAQGDFKNHSRRRKEEDFGAKLGRDWILVLEEDGDLLQQVLRLLTSAATGLIVRAKFRCGLAWTIAHRDGSQK